MKILTSILALFIVSFTMNAQFGSKKIKGNGHVVSENRTTESYEQINVAGSFDVELVKGTEGTITVKAEENLLPYIVTESKKGKLKISAKKGYQLRSTKKIMITVTFEDINGIALAGSGNVFSEDIIKSNNLKLKLAGSGDIKLNVDTDELHASIAGSGNINISGKSISFKCEIAGSGDVGSYDLNAKKVTVNIAGSGNAKVSVEEELHGRIAGSGDIFYSGNPMIEDVKSAGSGSAKKKR